MRLAIALSASREVLLIVNRDNRRKECDEWLTATARASLRMFEFSARSRLEELRATIAIVWRILLFRPTLLSVQEQIDNVTAWVVRLLRRVMPIALTVHDPKPHSGADTDWVIANARNRRDIRAAASLFHVHGRFCRGQLIAELGADRPIVVTVHGEILAPGPNRNGNAKPAAC